MKKKFQRNRIFTLNNPYAPRICPDLACEIGLNESLLLLQVEYWMATEGEERDGHLWIRRTGREIREVFKFWGVATIERAIQSLCKNGLFVIGGYDEGAGRGGRWIRFDFDQVSKLKSIKVDCSTLEHPMLHSDRETHQNGASVLIEEKNIDSKSARADNKEITRTHGEREPLYAIEEVQDPDLLPGIESQLSAFGLDFTHVYRQWWLKYFRLGGIGRRPGSKATARQYSASLESYFSTWARNDKRQNGNGRPKVEPGKLSPDIRITTPEELEKMLGPSIKPK